MSSSGREQHEGFDRGRILDWLEGVDVYHQPSSQLDEVDEESNFDSEEPPPVTTRPTPPSQQQQQQRLHNLSSFIQRHSRSPTNNSGAPAQRKESSASPHPVLERASLAATIDTTLSQPHTHLRSLHSRQKSESPLPEFAVDSELPVFDPKTPALPGNRTPRLSLRSEAVLSRHQPPALIHARPGLGSVTLSCPVLHVPEMNPPPPPHQSLRSPSPLTSRYKVGRHSSEVQLKPVKSGGINQTKDDRGTKKQGDEEEREEESFASVPTSHAHTRENPSPKASQEKEMTQDPHCVSPPPLPHPLSVSIDDRATCVSEPQLRSSIVSPYNLTLMENIVPGNDEQPPEKAEGEEIDSLSSVELASLSLRVVDILPQLAVYLGVEYGEYEDVVACEPSPQRQSMSILMKWYRSGTGCSRQSLAQALQQFGDQYSQLAQLLLRGDLEEHHPVSDGTLQTQKLTPSPSPTPLSHPPHPPPPPTHPSPEHHRHHGPHSPSPSPSSVLSPQSRRLKAGFTFDEDCRSSDSLPKFLSTRSLFTTSPDSPHVSGGHTPRSQPVIQRHLSLSDVSSGSTSSSWPATPRSGRASQRDSAYARQRKSSLPHGDPVEMSGRGYNRGRRGSSERQHGGSGWRKSSLHSDEILMSLTEYDRGIPTIGTLSQQNTSENVVRMRAGGSGSVDLGGETLGWSEDPRPGGHTTAPHRYRVIGSRTGQTAESPRHRSSLGTRQLAGLGNWGRRELGVSATGSHESRPPATFHGVADLASTSRRGIDRQDSGIETLASNFSTLH